MVDRLEKLEFSSKRSKEEWLAWKAEWRYCYKAISAEIHLARRMFKNLQRMIVVVRTDTNWGPEFWPFLRGGHLINQSEYRCLFAELRYLEKQAERLMVILSKAKTKQV